MTNVDKFFVTSNILLKLNREWLESTTVLNSLPHSLTPSTQVAAVPQAWVGLDVWHATQLCAACNWPPCS